MKVKEITCTVSRTVNLGEYNSLRVEWSETVEFNFAEGEGPDGGASLKSDLMEQVIDQVDTLGEASVPGFKARVGMLSLGGGHRR